MKRLKKNIRIYLLGLLPISLSLILLARKSSYFAEEIYAKHIYRWISQAISTITGLFPFSLAELIIITIPVALLVILVRFMIRLIMEKTKRSEIISNGLLNTLSALSAILFLFTILGGLNYYRYPFSSYSNLEISESTFEELYGLTKSLAIEASELRSEAPQTDENGVFQLSMSDYELAKLANEAYTSLSEEYPVLGGHYGNPKPILLSKLMSQTEIVGQFFPFTMEANVNVDVPDYSIPSTMLHELSHLRGFMREDEANYLAYLAGMKSENVEIRYSAVMDALIMAGNALYHQNPDRYFEIRSLYDEGINLDLKASSQYWQQYEDTVVSTVSNKINDTYLKANAQTDGVQSYGRMLDLLLAKYRKDMEEGQ